MLAGSVMSFYIPRVKKHPYFWNSSLWPHPLSARLLTNDRIYGIPAHWDSQYLRKGFSGTGRSGESRQLLCLFTAPKNEVDVKELTSSLLLLRLGGQRGQGWASEIKDIGKWITGQTNQKQMVRVELEVLEKARVNLWPETRISSHFCRHAYMILYSKSLKTYSYVWIFFIYIISLMAMELFIWGIAQQEYMLNCRVWASPQCIVSSYWLS